MSFKPSESEEDDSEIVISGIPASSIPFVSKLGDPKDFDSVIDIMIGLSAGFENMSSNGRDSLFATVAMFMVRQLSRNNLNLLEPEFDLDEEAFNKQTQPVGTCM